MGNLKGKRALITGASRGIGRAIALRLAQDGAEVAINYVNSKKEAEDLANEITSLGGKAIIAQGDVSNIDSINAMFVEIKEHWDNLDIVVNNAGRGEGHRPTLIDYTPQMYDKTFDTNTKGMFFVTQNAVNMMNDGGRVINISSTSVVCRVTGLAVYAASKAAVEVFTRIWAAELAPRQIRVSCVRPGMIATDLIRNGMGQGAIDAASKIAPFGRVGEPEDIANVVAFLASDDSKWISGEVIHTAGGQ